jgi:Fe-S-cluster containining protein
MEREWIRHGECNQCGDCCRHASNAITLFVPIADREYARVRFGEPVAPPDLYQLVGPILMPCPKLDGDRCGIHDTKPTFCTEAPFKPEDVEGTRCSYWFEHRETGEIVRITPEANNT